MTLRIGVTPGEPAGIGPDLIVELAQQKSQALRSGHGGFQHPGVAAQSIVGNQIGTRQHKAKALELAGESVDEVERHRQHDVDASHHGCNA